MQHADALFSGGVDIGADDAKVLSAAEGAKAAGTLCLDFGRRNVRSDKLLVKGTARSCIKYSTSVSCCSNRCSRLKALDCLVRPLRPSIFAAAGLSASPASCAPDR